MLFLCEMGIFGSRNACVIFILQAFSIIVRKKQIVCCYVNNAAFIKISFVDGKGISSRRLYKKIRGIRDITRNLFHKIFFKVVHIALNDYYCELDVFNIKKVKKC